MIPLLVVLVAFLASGCGTQQVDGSQDLQPSAPQSPASSASAPLSAAAAWEAAHALAAGPSLEQLAPGLPPSVTGFDTARAWQHLRRQVAFGPRPSGSGAIDANRRYLIEQLQRMGIGTRQQAFFAQTPAGEVPMINIIATIPGKRRERIIIGSHFDTKRAPFPFVGANDGASSTAALLEIARVLRGRPAEFTLELLFLDGEEAVGWDWGVTGEDNTYGSRHYVAEAARTGRLDDVVAFVLLDMVGDRDLRILRDAHSTPWLVDVIWSAARQLGHGSVFVEETTQIEDDHVSFLRAGVPAVDVIDLEYPAWHTATDTVDQLSPRSLQIVGDVVLTALPQIEKRAAAR